MSQKACPVKCEAYLTRVYKVFKVSAIGGSAYGGRSSINNILINKLK